MDNHTVIRRAIYVDSVLRCWVEGVSRRGPGIDLIPLITRIPAPYMNRVTIAAIPPDHFDAWLRQIPPTVRAACSAPSRAAIAIPPARVEVSTPFAINESTVEPTSTESQRVYPLKRRTRHTSWTGELSLPTVCRRVNGKRIRVVAYPDKAISPPSSDDDDNETVPYLKAAAHQPLARAHKRNSTPPISPSKAEELRAAIDYLKTRVEIVERCSRRTKAKLSLHTAK